MSLSAQILLGVLFLLVTAVGIVGSHALTLHFGLDRKAEAPQLPTLDDARQARCDPAREPLPAFRVELDRQLTLR